MKNVSWIKVKNILKMYDAEQGRNTYLTLLLAVIAVVAFCFMTLNDYTDDPEFIHFLWRDNVSRFFSFTLVMLLPVIVMLFMEKFFYKGKLISKLTLPATVLEKYLGLALIFFKYNIIAYVCYLVLSVTALVYVGVNTCHFTPYEALRDITSNYLISWLITIIFICVSLFYAFVSQKTEVLRRAIASVIIGVVLIVYYIMTFKILPKGEPLTIVSQTLYVLIFSVILLVQGYNNLKRTNYEE